MVGIKADATPSQKWIVLLGQRQIRQRLVATDIDGADDDRPAAGRHDHLPVDLELMLFGRRFRLFHEQHLGAEQTDRLGTMAKRHIRLDGNRDIGGDLRSALRHFSHRCLLMRPHPDLLAVLGIVEPPHRSGGIGKDQATVAINQHHRGAGQPVKGPGSAKNRRDAKGTGQNDRMGSPSALFQHQTTQQLAIQRQKLLRRQLVGHHHGRTIQRLDARRRQFKPQRLQQLQRQPLDVPGPFPQINAARLLQLLHVMARRPHHGTANPGAIANLDKHLIAQHGIAQDRQMRL